MAPPPPFLSPSLPFPLLSYSNKEGGVLLPVGVGLLMGCAKGGRPLPPSFIYVGRGHPKDTPSPLLAVCSAPPP